MVLPRKKISFLICFLALFVWLGWPAHGFTAPQSITLNLSATVTTINQCKFNTKNSALAFGVLDPFNLADVQATATFLFICKGKDNPATFLFSHDSGLYETGVDSPQMAHTLQSGEFLPYEFSLSPPTGTIPKNSEQTLTITGTVRWADFQNALPGDFEDTVVISIFP
ncbi:MAG: hypothetical protein RQ754_03475 [Desulfuromonadales bacterium]|nr:hypothetical protein [Desulfuromonadales bacterium]